MKLDVAMWKKALNVIPDVSKQEWDHWMSVARWLISTRAAVLIMTFLSAALAGIFALRDHAFHFVPWLALALGLVMAHAANNIFNDFTDYVRGVDKDNYFRTIYGAQPIASGLMTKRAAPHLFRGDRPLRAAGRHVSAGHNGWDNGILILLGLGALFVLFYTWPLKYVAMGEITVFWSGDR